MITTERLAEVLSADVLVALADDDRDGEADPGVVEAALMASETTVRAAIDAGEYGQPELLPAPLEDAVLTLAVQRLFERKRELQAPVWDERAARVRALLRDVSDGVWRGGGLTRLRGRHLGNGDPDAPPPVQHFYRSST